MGILKDFLAYDNKIIDDMIMDYGHMVGFIRMDSSTFKWLEAQEKIEKYEGLDLIKIRNNINPWLFNQVTFLFMGMGFDSLEEVLICYRHESGLMFFTIDTSGFYAILCPIIDVKKEDDQNLNRKVEP